MDYETTRVRAAAKIRKFGMQMTLRVPSTGEVDHTGAAESDDPTDYTVYGIKRAYSLRERASDLIIQGDVEITLAVEDGTPEPQPERDLLIFSGDTWTVVNCEPKAPADVVLLYVVQARKQ